MIFEENHYTYMLSNLSSIAAKASETSNQVGFLVGGNIIFADLIPNDDERFTNKAFQEGKKLLMYAVPHVLEQRTKDMEAKLSDEELEACESVYLYLEKVTIHSTSNNKSIRIPEFALRISSIDGIFVGSTDSLPK